MDSVSAERVGQGEVSGFTHRVTCTWWLLGLAVKHRGWDLVGQFLPWLHVKKTLLSPCRGFISGRKAAWALSRCLTTKSADYCMLVKEWAWLRSQALIKVGSGVECGSRNKAIAHHRMCIHVVSSCSVHMHPSAL